MAAKAKPKPRAPRRPKHVPYHGARRIDYITIEHVRPAKVNPKYHAEAEIEASIMEVGYTTPAVLDERTGRLVEGHGRLAALFAIRDRGEDMPDGIEAAGNSWAMPVVRGWASKNDAEAAAMLVASNQLPALGGWDDAGLLPMLEPLSDDLLLTTGFTADDIMDLTEFADSPFKTITVAVADLKQHPRNYQDHPPDQIAEIRASIETHGFYRNVVVANELTTLAGHGVVIAAAEMGRRRIPVIQLDLDPDDPRALKVLTSDNEISRLAVIDDRGLTDLLRDILHTADDGLVGTGFNEEQLTALTFVTRPRDEIGSNDAAAEWAGMPEFEAKPPPVTLTVQFESAEDRLAFVEKFEIGTSARGEAGVGWSLDLEEV